MFVQDDNKAYPAAAHTVYTALADNTALADKTDNTELHTVLQAAVHMDRMAADHCSRNPLAEHKDSELAAYSDRKQDSLRLHLNHMTAFVKKTTHKEHGDRAA